MHRILRRNLLSEESLLPHYDDISHRFRSLIYDLTTFRLGCNPGRAILLRLGLSLFPSSWFRLPFLIIPLFFFLVSPLAGQSQTLPQAEISGTVTDQTGAAISGAEVTFTADSFSATQVTNDWGKFTFSNVPVEAGVARASADGFQVNTADWRTGSGPLQIVLLPATAAEQVTVTANRTGVRVVENATSVTILSGPDIEATAAFRLDDMLRQVPGFSLFRRTTSRSANPTTQGVSLRGLGASGASRALVLSDGFPLNDPFGGWVYWDRAPRESIQSLEVASGGASHLYGSDALGGVINIIRSPVNQDAVSLEAAYGNENSPNLSLAASKTLGPWSFGIASELFRTDGYIAVPSDLRGAVDTPVNSQDATGDVTVRRQFGIAEAFLFVDRCSASHATTGRRSKPTAPRSASWILAGTGTRTKSALSNCVLTPAARTLTSPFHRSPRTAARRASPVRSVSPRSRLGSQFSGSTVWGRARIWWPDWKNRTFMARPTSRDTSAAIPPALPRAEVER